MANDSQEQSNESTEPSFADILNEFERNSRPAQKAAASATGKRKGKGKPAGPPPKQGTVVGISGDFVLVDYGEKSEGVIPVADLRDSEGNLTVKVGDTMAVAITGFDSKGMATLSRTTAQRPRDWEGFSRAHQNAEIIVGRVTGVIKGGFSVDIGTRAFLPSSRSGVREAADMEKLVGQEIRCRIIKLDVDEEDVVIDRRSVMEKKPVSCVRILWRP
jgi:small subunit ribosomal protein S1